MKKKKGRNSLQTYVGMRDLVVRQRNGCRVVLSAKAELYPAKCSLGPRVEPCDVDGGWTGAWQHGHGNMGNDGVRDGERLVSP